MHRTGDVLHRMAEEKRPNARQRHDKATEDTLSPNDERSYQLMRTETRTYRLKGLTRILGS